MVVPRKVYAIQHNVTKRIYIGSSKDAQKRYLNHMYRLRQGKHHIEDMQKDFDEYGENYSLFILDDIQEFAERGKEYEWMHRLNTFTRGIGYNYKDHKKGAPNMTTIEKLRLGAEIEAENDRRVAEFLREQGEHQ